MLPALSGTVARGQIGAVNSDVRGFDLLAENITTDLGSVQYSEITFSPEVRRNLLEDGAGYIAFIPQWSCTNSKTAVLRDGCRTAAEIKLLLENTASGQTLMLSVTRDDFRQDGTSRVAAEILVRF